MNESWHNNPIIDLRQKAPRSVWRDLLAVRVVLFLVRILYRFAAVVIGLIYHIIRVVALAVIDSLFAVKGKFLNIKYNRAEEQLQHRYELDFFSSLPQRVDRGIKRETLRLHQTATKRTLAFRVFNFILLLFLVSAPFVAYSAWQSLSPLRASITSSTKEAVANLFAGKDLVEQQNFSGARNAFEQAGLDFIKAQEDLSSINSTLLELAAVVPDQKFKIASESRSLLAAGKISARLGAQLTQAVQPAPDGNVATFLERFAAHAAPAANEADDLVHELGKINVNNLPNEYREQFEELLAKAKLLAPSLRQAAGLAEQASVFLGKQMDRRYLLIFQNNAEKRGSGGFMGSFALIDMSKGQIKSLTVPKGGTYDTEAGLSIQVAAPEPLSLVNPQWHFWDANWWPDWPMSAKKIQWFYEKSNGPTVDGVISLTPTVIERLLELHGPVDMTKDYGVTITAQNFWVVTQTFSEQKPQVTREPKKIIGDLLTKLMEDLPKDMSPEKVFGLVGILEQSLSEKHIMIYLNDPVLQKSVASFGWDGAIKETNGDYLMIVNTNIGGQKTDRVIQEHIIHEARISEDGAMTVDLTITRAHPGEKNQPFVGVRNVDWLRVYVPEGSRLLAASGFTSPDASYFEAPDSRWFNDPDLSAERSAQVDPATGTKIYNEKGKTVFANWTMVDPGQTARIHLTYRLPFTLEQEANPQNWWQHILSYVGTKRSKKYSLLVQKQPGSTGSQFNSTLYLSKTWQPVWHYPDDVRVLDKGWSIQTTLLRDFYAVALFN